MGKWSVIQEDKGLVNTSWFLLAYQRDDTAFPPIIHTRVRGVALANTIVGFLNEYDITPEGPRE